MKNRYSIVAVSLVLTLAFTGIGEFSSSVYAQKNKYTRFELRESYILNLKITGFKVREDGLIVRFKFDDDDDYYTLGFNETEPLTMSIESPVIWKIKDEQEKQKARWSAEMANLIERDARIIVVRDQVIVTAESRYRVIADLKLFKSELYYMRGSILASKFHFEEFMAMDNSK